ncbi:hypothetical protein, partial [Sphingopyxis sp. KK2]|uniref:hypothetical protein n=1 Tax=Sphingopyxis sp. KK2 TaxID=1855727 RepID=UPI001C4DE6BA
MYQSAKRSTLRATRRAAPAVTPRLAQSGRPFASLSGIPARPAIQRKLVVGSANDPAELAADRRADAVMSMAEPAPRAAAQAGSTAAADTIRRKCQECGEDEKDIVRRQPMSGAAAPAAAPP